MVQRLKEIWLADKKRNGIPEIEFMKNSKMRELDNEDIILIRLEREYREKNHIWRQVLNLLSGLYTDIISQSPETNKIKSLGILLT